VVDHLVAKSGVAPIFAALGDPTRTAIVGLLAEQDRTVSDLADEFPISLQGTMKHLTVLERAGVVSRTKSGRIVTVRLERDRLEGAEEWLQRTRLFWTGQLGRLASHFEENT
jgi:DNA-binding transcriptional ArsR family regulator